MGSILSATTRLAFLALLCCSCSRTEPDLSERAGTPPGPPVAAGPAAPSRYVAWVAPDASGRPILRGPTPRSAAQDHPQAGPSGSPDSSAAGGSPRGTVPTVLRALAERRGPEVRLSFLVRLDPQGRPRAVDPVGPAPVTPEVSRGVASLLLATSFGARRPGDPVGVAVEVILPEAR